MARKEQAAALEKQEHELRMVLARCGNEYGTRQSARDI